MGLDYMVVKTNAGLALEQKLPNSGRLLKLVRAKAGAGKTATGLLSNLQDVVDPIQELELKDFLYPDEENDTLTIPVEVTNQGLETEYALYQIGVYAEDPEVGEILYLVAQIQREGGERIPSAASSPGFSAEYDLVIRTANAQKVEVVVSEAGRLTVAQADNRYSKRERHLSMLL